MPSDTMNDGNRHATLMAPVVVPHATPHTSPKATADGKFHCHDCSATAVRPLHSASTEPTDRSMPAITSTNVMPTDITSSAGTSFAMAVKVSRLRKYSLEIAEADDEDEQRERQADGVLHATLGTPRCAANAAVSNASSVHSPRSNI